MVCHDFPYGNFSLLSKSRCTSLASWGQTSGHLSFFQVATQTSLHCCTTELCCYLQHFLKVSLSLFSLPSSWTWGPYKPLPVMVVQRGEQRSWSWKKETWDPSPLLVARLVWWGYNFRGGFSPCQHITTALLVRHGRWLEHLLPQRSPCCFPAQGFPLGFLWATDRQQLQVRWNDPLDNIALQICSTPLRGILAQLISSVH